MRGLKQLTTSTHVLETDEIEGDGMGSSVERNSNNRQSSHTVTVWITMKRMVRDDQTRRIKELKEFTHVVSTEDR